MTQIAEITFATYPDIRTHMSFAPPFPAAEHPEYFRFSTGFTRKGPARDEIATPPNANTTSPATSSTETTQ